MDEDELLRALKPVIEMGIDEESCGSDVKEKISSLYNELNIKTWRKKRTNISFYSELESYFLKNSDSLDLLVPYLDTKSIFQLSMTSKTIHKTVETLCAPQKKFFFPVHNILSKNNIFLKEKKNNNNNNKSFKEIINHFSNKSKVKKIVGYLIEFPSLKSTPCEDFPMINSKIFNINKNLFLYNAIETIQEISGQSDTLLLKFKNNKSTYLLRKNEIRNRKQFPDYFLMAQTDLQPDLQPDLQTGLDSQIDLDLDLDSEERDLTYELLLLESTTYRQNKVFFYSSASGRQKNYFPSLSPHRNIYAPKSLDHNNNKSKSKKYFPYRYVDFDYETNGPVLIVSNDSMAMSPPFPDFEDPLFKKCQRLFESLYVRCFYKRCLQSVPLDTIFVESCLIEEKDVKVTVYSRGPFIWITDFQSLNVPLPFLSGCTESISGSNNFCYDQETGVLLKIGGTNKSSCRKLNEIFSFPLKIFIKEIKEKKETSENMYNAFYNKLNVLADYFESSYHSSGMSFFDIYRKGPAHLYNNNDDYKWSLVGSLRDPRTHISKSFVMNKTLFVLGGLSKATNDDLPVIDVLERGENGVYYPQKIANEKIPTIRDIGGKKRDLGVEIWPISL
jgi:hypothetical protein